MKSNKSKLFFSSILLAIVIVFIFTAFDYGPQSRLIPLVVAFGTLSLLVPVILNEIHPIRLIREIDISLMGDMGGGVIEEGPEYQVPIKKLFLFLLWISGFFLVVFIFGFHIGIAGFTFLFLKIEGGVRWTKSIIFAVLLWAGVFVMFETLMGFSLFKGWIFGSVIPQI